MTRDVNHDCGYFLCHYTDGDDYSTKLDKKTESGKPFYVKSVKEIKGEPTEHL
ncbi:MAG: hypothetical protein K1W14_13920 [Muribaculaceae bacterium]